MRVVIDTSLWIDYNRGAVGPEERAQIEQLWREGRAILYQFVWLPPIAWALNSPITIATSLLR